MISQKKSHTLEKVMTEIIPDKRLTAQSRPTLLMRTDARQNENRQDYLMRLAAGNLLNGIPALCSVLGSDYQTLVSLPAISLNAFLNGVPLRRILLTVNAPFTSRELPLRGLSSRARICPLCIKESKPMAVRFNFSFPIPCQIHGLMPVDICPGCSTPLSYLRRRIEFCNCGQSLGACVRRLPPPWLKTFYIIFTPWHLAPVAKGTSAEVALRDVSTSRLLQQLLTCNASPYPRKSFDPWLSAENFGFAEKYFIDWPTNFEQTFAYIYERASSFQRAVLLERVRICTSSTLLEAVQSILERHCEKKRTPNSNGIRGDENCVRASRLRKAAKLDSKAMHGYLASRKSSAVSKTSDGTDTKQYWVSNEEIIAIEEYFSTTINVASAAKILGCSEICVRALVRCKFIPAEFLTVKPRSPRFRAAALERWLENLRRVAQPLSQASGHTVSFAEIPCCSSSQEVLKSWQKLVNKVQLCEVKLYFSETSASMSHLHLSVDEVPRYAEKKNHLTRFHDGI